MANYTQSLVELSSSAIVPRMQAAFPRCFATLSRSIVNVLALVSCHTVFILWAKWLKKLHSRTFLMFRLQLTGKCTNILIGKSVVSMGYRDFLTSI